MNNIISDDAKSPELNRRLEDDKPSKDIFNHPKKRQNPQISSISGVSSIKLESPCYCGSLKGKLGAGKKPGEASLLCDKCRTFIAWLSDRQIKELAKRGGES